MDSGVAPLKKYFDNGINIALGTDGPASNHGLDMFREMQLVVDHQKGSIPPFEILKMATVNASKAMGLDNADVLAVGKYADIIMLDLSKPNMKQSNDIISNVVCYGNKDNVVLTMINGQILFENGVYHINDNIEEIYKKAEEISRRLANK